LGEREDFHERKSNGSFIAGYRPKFKLVLLSLSRDALNKIPTCGVAGISNPSMCDVCVFFPTVVSEINVFAVLWFLVLPFSDLNLAVSPTKVDKLKAEVQR